MNQEENNLNLSNFNTNGDNGIPNNQSFQNNQSRDFNQQPTNSQPTPSYHKPISQMNIQETTPQYMNLVESQNTNNQKFYIKQPKKINLGLIIGIVVVLVIIFFIIVALITATNNNKSDMDKTLENNSMKKDNFNIRGTVDKNTNTNYDENGAFLLRIEDVFTIAGRGILVTGVVERGTIKKYDEIQIIGLDKEIITVVATGIEANRLELDYATIGDSVGIELRGMDRDQIQAGQVVVQPNSIIATKKFDANLSVISTEKGGRETPFFDGFSPHFYFGTDIKGKINLPKGKKFVNPGEVVDVTVSLTTSIAMDVGTKFSIREGGKTIANGVVTKVY